MFAAQNFPSIFRKGGLPNVQAGVAELMMLFLIWYICTHTGW